MRTVFVNVLSHGVYDLLLGAKWSRPRYSIIVVCTIVSTNPDLFLKKFACWSFC